AHATTRPPLPLPVFRDFWCGSTPHGIIRVAMPSSADRKDSSMKTTVSLLLAAGVLAGGFTLGLARQATPAGNQPPVTADNRLMVPENDREWVWLSAGLGMA